MEGIRFEWSEGARVSLDTRAACAALFERHYGRWSAKRSHRPGERIKLPQGWIDRLLGLPESRLALARQGTDVLAYAIAVQAASSSGMVSWVTQLVVHEDWRDRGIAKRLLGSIWGFSDHFAWGLVSSNPFAVRALEKATRREVEPLVILEHHAELESFAREFVEYVAGRPFRIDEHTSRVDTEFEVDHSTLESKLDRLTRRGVVWRLGDLPEGWEWYAFTFAAQPARAVSSADLESMFADSDAILREAYARMALDEGHRWMRHTPHEVDVAADLLGCGSGTRVLDVGCGTGRHALELARRGVTVVGIDFVAAAVAQAAEAARREGLRARFETLDARRLDLAEKFDAALALYDVVGSFPSDDDNAELLAAIHAHLVPGGRLLLSVMSLDATARIAKHRAAVMREPDALTALPPSRTMQDSGAVFDPDHFLLDEAEGLVYRREQFDRGGGLPTELIVRDRRYRPADISALLHRVGFDVHWARPVAIGHWPDPLPSDDSRAKEILVLAERR